MEKSVKNPSLESPLATTKRAHKHKDHHHHHHHHHHDKHHHHHHAHHRHRHDGRRSRARSAETIRDRQQQTLLSASKIMPVNTQYIEQDQQQPMVVYRELPNNEGYTIDNNSLATVPYGIENETMLADDQQAPIIFYQDANFQQQQQQQQIVTDTFPQQVFLNQDQETVSLSIKSLLFSSFSYSYSIFKIPFTIV